MNYLSRLKALENQVFSSNATKSDLPKLTLPEFQAEGEGSGSFGSSISSNSIKKIHQASLSGPPAVRGTTITEVMGNFRFDLVQAEIDVGYPSEELRRVNNIAYQLIAERSWSFEDAIKSAAHWVVNNPPHKDEAMFDDVMILFRKIRQ